MKTLFTAVNQIRIYSYDTLGSMIVKFLVVIFVIVLIK